MTKRVACPAAPAPLEAYACEFDDLFSHVAQRAAFREYLQGVLLPRDRNKTITGIVGAEPVSGASDADVQHVDCFLAESTWHSDALHQRRIELLLADSETTSHERGVLVIDDSGGGRRLPARGPDGADPGGASTSPTFPREGGGSPTILNSPES